MNTLSDELLLFQSDEHLYYEIMMFLLTGHMIATSPDPGTGKERVTNNALTESFAIHVRVLIEFFFPIELWRDSVTAQHFMPDGIEWSQIVGEPTATLLEAKRRANKEIAHFTDRRIAGEPDAKDWAAAEIVSEMRKVLIQFVSASSPRRLHDSIAELLHRCESDELCDRALAKEVRRRRYTVSPPLRH